MKKSYTLSLIFIRDILKRRHDDDMLVSYFSYEYMPPYLVPILSLHAVLTLIIFLHCGLSTGNMIIYSCKAEKRRRTQRINSYSGYGDYLL